MKRILILLLLTVPLFADDLSDEFATADSLAKWSRFETAEGWPDMAKRVAVDDGKLVVEPWTSGWYAEFHAPFLFREVSGAFDVTARVRVRGKKSDLPDEPWSLAGLMVREARPNSAKTWEPRAENWLFLTTGIAFETGKPVFETKTTVNSRSNLKLAPARSGWIELRIVRSGPNFTLMSRYDGEEWQTRETFFRSDLPRTLQVGVNAYTGWNSAQDLQNDPQKFNTTILKDRRADAILEVDWIRFAKPAEPQGAIRR
ncbi:MAG TPA: DUF1349 domain-containing protein [Thermoanaerobaculia bacterium]